MNLITQVTEGDFCFPKYFRIIMKEAAKKEAEYCATSYDYINKE